jgi:very-short-patch-repair endonuclease
VQRRYDPATVEQLTGLFAVERRIAALSRPHGVVGRDQLIAAGISCKVIANRVDARSLRMMHRGVYAVGGVQSEEAPEAAAVLACGEGSVLSHTSAAFLWRVVTRRDRGPMQVTVPAVRCPRRPGIRVHRTTELQPDEVMKLRRIPITTPARTLLDLAVQLSARELEQAVAQAERRNLVTRSKLLALLARYPRRPGTARLRPLLDGPGRPVFTRSEAEERFLALVRRAELPVPEVNVSLHGYEIDFLWRDDALAVEIDGFAFHRDRAAFEADRRRDADLVARGIQVMRITWRGIAEEPEAILVRLAQALAGR